MKCDKAQEFFSEYIESTLDAPMTVALETHLNGCEACSAEMADLRSMWAVLDKVPQVEPPADFVWHTTTRLQNEVLNRREAERAKPLPWWKRLTPAQSFSYAGIAALLAVAMAFGLPGTIRGNTEWNPLSWIFHRQPTQYTPQMPMVQVTPPQFGVQVPGANGAAATVTITATSDLPTAGVAMALLVPRGEDLKGRPVRVGVPRTLPAGQTLTLPPVQAGGSQAVAITVFSSGQTFQKTLILPGAAPLTVPMQNANPYFALQQVAARLGQPMLVDSGLTAPVTLNLQNEAPQQALQDLLAQVGARTPVVQNGVLVITK